LPVGLQLVGRWHDEERLLNLSEDLEAVLGFDHTPVRRQW